MEVAPIDTVDLSLLERERENIQPLRAGRTAQQLITIVQLSSDSTLVYQENNKTVSDYEHEINNYTGDDILSVWVEYIDKLHTIHYQSSFQSRILPYVECCINSLGKIEKYKNDPRFVKLWLMLAESTSDSLRYYRYMQCNGIGTKITQFYLNYSQALYVKGFYRAAMEILRTGQKDKVPQLENRYAYIIRCEKNRLSKLLDIVVDNNKLKELIKENKQFGAQYNFTDDSKVTLSGLELSNIGNNNNNNSIQIPTYPSSGGNTSSNLTQHRPQQPKAKSAGAKTSSDIPEPSFTIYQDSDDDDEPENNEETKPFNAVTHVAKNDYTTRMMQGKTMSMKNPYALLATRNHKIKENVFPFTGTFEPDMISDTASISSQTSCRSNCSTRSSGSKMSQETRFKNNSLFERLEHGKGGQFDIYEDDDDDQ